MAVSVLVESGGIVAWTCQADIKRLPLLYLKPSAQAFPALIVLLVPPATVTIAVAGTAAIALITSSYVQGNHPELSAELGGIRTDDSGNNRLGAAVGTQAHEGLRGAVVSGGHHTRLDPSAGHLTKEAEFDAGALEGIRGVVAHPHDQRILKQSPGVGPLAVAGDDTEGAGLSRLRESQICGHTPDQQTRKGDADAHKKASPKVGIRIVDLHLPRRCVIAHGTRPALECNNLHPLGHSESPRSGSE